MDQEITKEIIKRINKFELRSRISSTLKNRGLSENEIESYFELANQKILENKLKTLPKKRKLTFALLIFLSVITFFLWFYVIPRIAYNYFFLIPISIFGSSVFVLSLSYAWAHYNSWDLEKIKNEIKSNVNYFNKLPHGTLLFCSFFLVCIVSIFFHEILERGADQILKTTQIRTQGKIIAGTYTTSDMGEYGEITVKFTTKEGKIMIATENISKSEFRDLHEDQIVDIAYSSLDPKNISLLISKDDLKTFTNLEERNFRTEDLLHLLDTPDNEVLPFLNKISNGWQFYENKRVWLNDRISSTYLKTASGNSLSSKNELTMQSFPKDLVSMGYTETTKGANENINLQKDRTFKKGNINVSIELEVNDGEQFCLITFNRKKKY